MRMQVLLLAIYGSNDPMRDDAEALEKLFAKADMVGEAGGRVARMCPCLVPHDGVTECACRACCMLHVSRQGTRSIMEPTKQGPCL